MIIRCPECSTGFKLPDERVTPEGTKLKCSRCEHVFRVREDDAGEVEIFYRSHDNKEEATAAAGGGDNPFPHAGLDLKPKAASAFGDDDESDQASQSEFEEEAASELQDVVEEPGQEEDHGEASSHKETDALSESGGNVGDPEDDVDPSFGEGGSVFDSEQGKVTPDAGGDSGGAEAKTAAGGPKRGGSAGPKRGGSAGPPAGAVGPPPTQVANSGPPASSKSAAEQGSAGPASSGQNAAAKPSLGSNPEPQPAASPDHWDEDDLEPHNIGGSTGQRVVTVLLIMVLIGAGFIGTVAVLNDGFVDFRAFDEMLGVAFSDGEYEPREEWKETTTEVTVVEGAAPLVVEGVYGEVIDVGEEEQILVVQGIVRNNKDSRLQDMDLRGMITTVEGRSLREIVAPVTAGAESIGAFRDLDSVDDVDGLLGGNRAAIEPGDAAPFTMVFDDVPQRVVDGERFSYRVEIVE